MSRRGGATLRRFNDGSMPFSSKPSFDGQKANEHDAPLETKCVSLRQQHRWKQMPRNLQRTPLELGLQLNINRLIRDGFIQPGKSLSYQIFLG